MEKLSKSIIDKKPSEDLPVKILQFGTGNFLRGFIEPMVSQMNQQGTFGGKITMLQSTSHSKSQSLAHQDFLYTLCLRGMKNGDVSKEMNVIDCIEGSINLNEAFSTYLKQAENPDLRIIISNTTEAGIVFNEEDTPELSPPNSFPAKLLCLLKARYDYFKGDQSKGLLIFPCELIDDNGNILKDILLKLSDLWYKNDKKFREWLIEANVFFNTLVDRIVSGFPHEESEMIYSELGYEDPFLVAGELYHFLAIEGPKEYLKEFPLDSIQANFEWCDDITPFRTRKVRMLNGAHTMMVPVAFLKGLNTVYESMSDDLINKYLNKALRDEVLPILEGNDNDLNNFADAVLERFCNPTIQHRLLSISLNSFSKYKTRVLPSLKEYLQKFNKLPDLMIFSLSALVAFYKGTTLENDTIKNIRKHDGSEYDIIDTPEILNWIHTLWQEHKKPNENDCCDLMNKILSTKDVWDEDLNSITELAEKSGHFLHLILNKGIEKAIEESKLI